MTLSKRAVTDLLEAHALRPSRALGQNFVVDANTVRRIARLAEVGPGDDVVEIGAGLGSLTMALAETGASVTAVEVDRHLVPLLRANVEAAGVRVVEADALTLSWSALLETGADPGDAVSAPSWSLVANLPYNVAVPVLVRVLDEAPAVTRMLVMVQHEVGERLVAQPHTRIYGAVSVKVAYHAHARRVGRVPPSVFVPRPRVESALVRIDRRPVVAVDPVLVAPDRLFALVRAGFAQRRKMLRRSLAGVVDAQAFVAAGVDPAARAEDLDVVAWGRLAAMAGQGGAPPDGGTNHAAGTGPEAPS
ncbi:MAG TPA: 16S rRNA (adenine(1518)-N(6)/adenine(1519)-N(6))-dimethyltransferase RsmA [Candidatus Sulfotelmatobacter sp.]|nr:16S rRNA (adenine(1518)-N(6)/adenine(1519)-N(6))-dimethyltransferase RsmA [Candidatus Sulfotelmatobacter sp.]